ncbi:IclR family transcriptional regulator [Labedella phragmitis]|uniref:IclR family transcriptional regulator n=1 Tax=Labedella phragmitis TaxID=2498849 RepID=A0A444PRR7_9MICO|nr:IclR family transcriptional regulator [Labedella phragmitis]RWZ49915.1 IclR family transcriptional regulator [Labedella phragmitis]
MSQSLERSLDALDLIAEGCGSLDALAARLQVHKTTVLRLLRVLEARGYVTRDRQHRYRIGPTLYRFSHNAPETDDVREAAAPHMRALARQIGQTVHLAEYRDGVVTYVDKVDSGHTLRMYSRVGLPAPLHATAVAKVLLGDIDDAERRHVLATHEFTPYTGRTVRDRPTLEAAIAEAAERGWAVDHEEHETFMNCIAAPVHAADGRIAAAMSVSVPNILLSYDEVLGLLPELLDTVAAVSADLGFHSPHTFIPPTTDESETV